MERSPLTLLVEIELLEGFAPGEPHRPVGAENVACLEQVRRGRRRVAIRRVFPDQDFRLGGTDRSRPCQQGGDVRSLVRLVVDQQTEPVGRDTFLLQWVGAGRDLHAHPAIKLGRAHLRAAERALQRARIVGDRKENHVLLGVGPQRDPLVELPGVEPHAVR